MRLLVMLRPALSLLIGFSVLTGLAYPLVVTEIGQSLFPQQAQGSLLSHQGHVVGSALIGQNFSQTHYFWGRPSATSPEPYQATASGGSNLGPNHPDLGQAVIARVKALTAADPRHRQAIPVDLVTTSASGLDPDVSLAAAEYQVERVSQARGVSAQQLLSIIHQLAQTSVWQEPHINVLQLNLALDQQFPLSTPRS